MIYDIPALEEVDHKVIALINEQRDRLRVFTEHSPRRWFGSLRRSTFARAIQGSNSIEGYHASMEDAIAVVEGEPPLDPQTETYRAIKGYRDAMTYIMQVAHDPYFEFSKQFLKSLHFMMIGYDMSKNPGQWRPGSIYVVDQASHQRVYEGPAPEMVNGLVERLVIYLESEPTEPTIVRAAMAHLNLTMIHPFSDGNGRMARALQTLILARDGLMHPVFSSIEEWLGKNTQEYYAILGATGEGRWQPERSALGWVRFCLKAHYQQAATLIRRNEEYGEIYDRVVDVVRREGVPERAALPLFDAALGFRITNTRYRADTDVTEFVASRDLKKLCEANLLEPLGEKRGRTYRAAQELRDIRLSFRTNRPLEDPYLVVEGARSASEHHFFPEPRLPGM